MLRKWSAGIAAAALVMASSPVALAGDAAQNTQTVQKQNAPQGPLAPGRAAGVRQAQMFSNGYLFWWALGVGALVGGVVLATHNNHHHTTPTPTPTTTGTH